MHVCVYIYIYKLVVVVGYVILYHIILYCVVSYCMA